MSSASVRIFTYRRWGYRCLSQLVLDFCEEEARGFSISIIVHRCGVDVGYLLVESPFAQEDLANLLQQTLEIVLAKECSIFHALSVKYISAQIKITQHTRRPSAELRRPR